MFNINKNFYANTAFNACHILGILQTTAYDYAGECDTLEELADHAFNDGCLFTYTRYAEQALQNAGVFDCFQVVHNYMMDMFGKDDTDYYNPVDVANLLSYIQGEKMTQAVAEWIGVDLDDELTPDQWYKLVSVNVKNLIPLLDDFHSFKEY